MEPKYIDPLTDFSFKHLFGTEPNKDLLIDLLNGILQGRKVITDLVYNKNEHVGNGSTIGSVIFDLTCTGNDGSQFLIEVQRTDQSHLKRRMLYYSSKLIVDQAPRGKRSAWNYDISEVYVIVLMDGFQMPGGSDGRYLHDICLCNRDTGKVFYEEFGFFYVELRNFVKQKSELATDLDRWLYVLTNMSKMDKLPLYLRKPIFEKLFDIAEYSKLNKEERSMYDVSLKRRWDEYSVRETARKKGYDDGLEQGMAKGIEEGIAKGMEKGIAKGMEKGIEEGIEKGMEKGIKQGIAQGKSALVRNLLAEFGFSDIQAAKAAEVSVEFVQQVRQELAGEK